jgi:ribonuclease Z
LPGAAWSAPARPLRGLIRAGVTLACGMIRVTFLGTAAARPTVARNVSAIALQREGDLWLVDCGEGTQRQMMRYGTGFALRGILVTHLHGDHVLGLTGLLRTLALQDRTEPLPVWGPPGTAAALSSIVHLGGRLSAYPVPVLELAPGEAIEFDEYRIAAFQVRHGVPAVGYALREHDRPGRFDVERARALGIPEGPLYGRLHSGESIEFEGRTIRPGELVGAPRPGRLVAISGDTRPTSTTVEAARGADLLVHDATFGQDEAERARETHHATAHEAARVGLEAGVRRLALTHLSARYSANAAPLELEARAVLPGTQVAWDGLTIEIGYRQDDEAGPTGAAPEGSVSKGAVPEGAPDGPEPAESAPGEASEAGTAGSATRAD